MLSDPGAGRVSSPGGNLPTSQGLAQLSRYHAHASGARFGEWLCHVLKKSIEASRAVTVYCHAGSADSSSNANASLGALDPLIQSHPQRVDVPAMVALSGSPLLKGAVVLGSHSSASKLHQDFRFLM